jgi:hypothetical protein
MRHARRLALFTMLALAMCGLAVGAPRAGVAQQTTVQPGTTAIWVENSSNLTSSTFNIGDAIQVCYRIPIVGMITITDFPADGSSNTFFSGVTNSTQGCLPGTVTPPSGHECMQLSYPLFGGQGQTKTCFTVAGSQPPINQLAIYINPPQQVYTVGQAIDVCYRVPAPGAIRIIDQIGTDTPTTFFSGYDDGTGGCIPGTITPPTGSECLTIAYTYSTGQQISAQACFQTTG